MSNFLKLRCFSSFKVVNYNAWGFVENILLEISIVFLVLKENLPTVGEVLLEIYWIIVTSTWRFVPDGFVKKYLKFTKKVRHNSHLTSSSWKICVNSRVFINFTCYIFYLVRHTVMKLFFITYTCLKIFQIFILIISSKCLMVFRYFDICIHFKYN